MRGHAYPALGAGCKESPRIFMPACSRMKGRGAYEQYEDDVFKAWEPV